MCVPSYYLQSCLLLGSVLATLELTSYRVSVREEGKASLRALIGVNLVLKSWAERQGNSGASSGRQQLLPSDKLKVWLVPLSLK